MSTHTHLKKNTTFSLFHFGNWGLCSNYCGIAGSLQVPCVLKSYTEESSRESLKPVFRSGFLQAGSDCFEFLLGLGGLAVEVGRITARDVSVGVSVALQFRSPTGGICISCKQNMSKPGKWLLALEVENCFAFWLNLKGLCDSCSLQSWSIFIGLRIVLYPNFETLKTG